MKNGTIDVNGNHFHYIQFGQGKEQLVLIPGLGDGIVTVKNKALISAMIFRPYKAKYTMTIISRKNELEHGATTETMAADQAEAMQKLGIHQAHIIGISQGGMIAQHLAADYQYITCYR